MSKLSASKPHSNLPLNHEELHAGLRSARAPKTVDVLPLPETRFTASLLSQPELSGAVNPNSSVAELAAGVVGEREEKQAQTKAIRAPGTYPNPLYPNPDPYSQRTAWSRCALAPDASGVSEVSASSPSQDTDRPIPSLGTDISSLAPVDDRKALEAMRRADEAALKHILNTTQGRVELPEELQAELAEMAEKLASLVKGDRFFSDWLGVNLSETPEIVVVHAMEANAWVMNGEPGRIYVTSAALNKLTPQAVFALLAHEHGHLVYHSIVSQEGSQASSPPLVRPNGETVWQDPFMTVVAEATHGAVLLRKIGMRPEELWADFYARHALALLGQDPRNVEAGLATVVSGDSFKELESDDDPESVRRSFFSDLRDILSSHPTLPVSLNSARRMAELWPAGQIAMGEFLRGKAPFAGNLPTVDPKVDAFVGDAIHYHALLKQLAGMFMFMSICGQGALANIRINSAASDHSPLANERVPEFAKIQTALSFALTKALLCQMSRGWGNTNIEILTSERGVNRKGQYYRPLSSSIDRWFQEPAELFLGTLAGFLVGAKRADAGYIHTAFSRMIRASYADEHKDNAKEIIPADAEPPRTLAGFIGFLPFDENALAGRLMQVFNGMKVGVSLKFLGQIGGQFHHDVQKAVDHGIYLGTLLSDGHGKPDLRDTLLRLLGQDSSSQIEESNPWFCSAIDLSLDLNNLGKGLFGDLRRNLGPELNLTLEQDLFRRVQRMLKNGLIVATTANCPLGPVRTLNMEISRLISTATDPHVRYLLDRPSSRFLLILKVLLGEGYTEQTVEHAFRVLAEAGMSPGVKYLGDLLFDSESAEGSLCGHAEWHPVIFINSLLEHLFKSDDYHSKARLIKKLQVFYPQLIDAVLRLGGGKLLGSVAAPLLLEPIFFKISSPSPLENRHDSRAKGRRLFDSLFAKHDTLPEFLEALKREPHLFSPELWLEISEKYVTNYVNLEILLEFIGEAHASSRPELTPWREHNKINSCMAVVGCGLTKLMEKNLLSNADAVKALNYVSTLPRTARRNAALSALLNFYSDRREAESCREILEKLETEPYSQIAKELFETVKRNASGKLFELEADIGSRARVISGADYDHSIEKALRDSHMEKPDRRGRGNSGRGSRGGYERIKSNSILAAGEEFVTAMPINKDSPWARYLPLQLRPISYHDRFIDVDALRNCVLSDPDLGLVPPSEQLPISSESVGLAEQAAKRAIASGLFKDPKRADLELNDISTLRDYLAEVCQLQPCPTNLRDEWLLYAVEKLPDNLVSEQVFTEIRLLLFSPLNAETLAQASFKRLLESSSDVDQLLDWLRKNMPAYSEVRNLELNKVAFLGCNELQARKLQSLYYFPGFVNVIPNVSTTARSVLMELQLSMLSNFSDEDKLIFLFYCYGLYGNEEPWIKKYLEQLWGHKLDSIIDFNVKASQTTVLEVLHNLLGGTDGVFVKGSPAGHRILAKRLAECLYLTLNKGLADEGLKKTLEIISLKIFEKSGFPVDAKINILAELIAWTRDGDSNESQSKKLSRLICNVARGIGGPAGIRILQGMVSAGLFSGELSQELSSIHDQAGFPNPIEPFVVLRDDGIEGVTLKPLAAGTLASVYEVVGAAVQPPQLDLVAKVTRLAVGQVTQRLRAPLRELAEAVQALGYAWSAQQVDGVVQTVSAEAEERAVSAEAERTGRKIADIIAQALGEAEVEELGSHFSIALPGLKIVVPSAVSLGEEQVRQKGSIVMSRLEIETLARANLNRKEQGLEEYLRGKSADMEAFADTMLRIFSSSLLKQGVFFRDFHFGNVGLVQQGSETYLGMLDFGSVDEEFPLSWVNWLFRFAGHFIMTDSFSDQQVANDLLEALAQADGVRLSPQDTQKVLEDIKAGRAKLGQEIRDYINQLRDLLAEVQTPKSFLEQLANLQINPEKITKSGEFAQLVTQLSGFLNYISSLQLPLPLVHLKEGVQRVASFVPYSSAELKLELAFTLLKKIISESKVGDPAELKKMESVQRDLLISLGVLIREEDFVSPAEWLERIAERSTEEERRALSDIISELELPQGTVLYIKGEEGVDVYIATKKVVVRAEGFQFYGRKSGDQSPATRILNPTTVGYLEIPLITGIIRIGLRAFFDLLDE
jgi:hypothetical protein